MARTRRQQENWDLLNQHKDRERALQQLRDDNARLEVKLIEKQQENWDLLNQHKVHVRRLAEFDAVAAHNQVLQSDRDRLTATIESLARRLASPTAERDASRAGWRAANRLTPQNLQPVEEASEAKSA
jgi:hypothetical protein